MRDQFLGVVSDISHPDEMEKLVALMYAQTRSQWEMVSMQVAYQTQSGGASPLAMHYSSLLCVLLQALELLLAPGAAENLSAVLANPLDTSSQHLIESEFGTTSATGVVAQARGWKDELATLTRRLADQSSQHDSQSIDLRVQITEATSENQRMQANQINLRRELGSWDSDEIVGIVRAARDSVVRMGDRMLILETNQATLERELGVSDGAEIAARMRKLSVENAALQDVADLFGAMEADLQTLEVN